MAKQITEQEMVYKPTKIKYNTQKQIWGFIFVIPWLLGIIIFFAVPFIQTIWYSLNDVKPSSMGLEISFVGIQNYLDAFLRLVIINQNFLQVLVQATRDLFINLPIILIFSLFIAVLLNTEFKGRGFVRAMFFIPVIFNTTAIDIAMSGQFNSYLQTNAGADGTTFFQALNFQNFLVEMGVGRELISFLIASVDRIFAIVNVSGVPILIFLAALQSIPNYLYEAAEIEGATPYEIFWKITFPLVSRMFLVVVVYAVVDSFVTSPVIYFIDQTRDQLKYGLSSAIAVIYFLMNILMLVVIYGIFRLLAGLGVFYNEKD